MNVKDAENQENPKSSIKQRAKVSYIGFTHQNFFVITRKSDMSCL